VDEVFYNDSKKVFDAFGLSFGDAVNMFLAKVAMEKKIPFALSLPSDELTERIKNIKADKNMQTFNDSDEAFKELGI
jgi:DNA-damage-inducible protein J